MVPAGSRRLAWRPLPLFGVEIEHDLSLPLTDEQGKEFVQLLWEQGLVLARGQRLSMERQREICAFAGPILLRAGESGYMSAVPDKEVTLSELSWHADAAYTDTPFDALALHIALQHARGSLKGCGKRVLQRVIVGREGTAPHIQA